MKLTPVSRDEIEELQRTLPVHAACMNPGCGEQCMYRHTRQGRQARFCSQRCRLAYGRQRRSLQTLLARLRWTLDLRELPAKPATIDRLVTQVAWVLDRYGGTDELDPKLVPQPPVIPLELAMRRIEGQPADDDPEWLAYKAKLDLFYRGRHRPHWPDSRSS